MIRSLWKRASRAVDVFLDNEPNGATSEADRIRSERFTYDDPRTGEPVDVTGGLFRRAEPLPRGTRIEDEHGNVIVRGDTVEQEYVQQFVAEDEVAMLRRKCDEYFKIIETIEKERNDWIEMWRTQSGEHLTAQAMLERSLAATRQTAARAILMLNKMRKDKDLKPIQGAEDLQPYDGEPIGLAEAYAERMLALREKLGTPIDAKAVRDAVDRRLSPAEDGARPSGGEATGPAATELCDAAVDG